ncbi:MAG: signal peptide peptidase SppA [Lentisphaerae bacterium]|jgi:protease-4|nr:signal peptide peptidase SppA [Lentisphaerota bacterium]
MDHQANPNLSQSTAEQADRSSAALPPPQYHSAPPPPPHYTARPVKQKRGFFSGCLVFLLVVLVCSASCVLLLGIFGHGCLNALDEWSTESSSFSTAFNKQDFRISRKVIIPAEDNSLEQIAVIKVQGVIRNSDGRSLRSAETIAEELRLASQDDNVVAIILDMDTPGGEVVASDEILHQVLACKTAGKPVVTCMRSMAASGGYFIASGSDWIIANRMTLTGSIGVIIGSYQISGLLDKIGIQPAIYRSGVMKDMLSPTREPSSLERDYIQNMVSSTFQEFCQVVANGREQYPTLEAVAAAPFGDGRVLSGADALAAGLVDQLGYMSDAIAKARELGDAANAAVVRYAYAPNWVDVFFSLKAPDSLNISGVTPPAAFALEPGKLYYLYPNACP